MSDQRKPGVACETATPPWPPHCRGANLVRCERPRSRKHATITPSKLITLQQAAEHLAVDPKTVRRWIAAGRIPGYYLRASHAVRLKMEDVEALLVPIVVKRGHSRRSA